jgi:hypothetical protein
MHRGDLADLTAFVVVADELSFRAAAARVAVTPSALSHAMRQLEDRLAMRISRSAPIRLNLMAGYEKAGMQQNDCARPRGLIASSCR